MISVYVKCILGFNGLQYIDDQYFFGTDKSPAVQNRQPGAAEASTTTPAAAPASKAATLCCQKVSEHVIM